MSLILASSRINENYTPENPSNFKNFYRSPIQIDSDSEIAVQSVKIQRTGNITIEGGDTFCHYFGQDPRLARTLDVPFDPYDDDNELCSFSRTIAPKTGTYSLSGYVKAIKDALNTQYDDPRTFGGYLVEPNTNADGEELGLEITCVDKGPANSDVTASLTAVPTYNIANRNDARNALISSITPSNGFSWTPGTGVVLRTAPDVVPDPITGRVSLKDQKAVAILNNAPFGLNDGEFRVETKNASAMPFVVGLTRPHIQYESYSNSQMSDLDEDGEYDPSYPEKRYSGIHALYDNDDYGIIRHNETGNRIGGTYELYDYAFYLDEDDNITIAERIYDKEFGSAAESNGFSAYSRMQEMPYWLNAFTGSTGAKLTKAQFNASWDGIQFKGKGDEVELYFKQNGKNVFDKVIGSSFANEAGRSFNPIGSTSYALYPQFHISKGSMTVTKYESSNVVGSYAYPTFTTGATGKYVSGDDAFSNESPARHNGLPYVILKPNICSNSIQSLVQMADSSVQKSLHSKVQPDPAGEYAYAGLNSANGVDYSHILTINKPTSTTNPLITTIGTQKGGSINMGARLGFKDRVFLVSNDTDGYQSGDDTLSVKFTSTGELEKSDISSFIRIPNLTHKSFNGGQSGLSKIVYQLPQFSNDGRQFGPLHFEPGEKTYVKLNNPSPMLLNELQIQIVDSQERELNSLTGITQVVFHIRKSHSH